MDQTEITILDALDELVKDNKITRENRVVFFGANKSSVFMIDKLDVYEKVAIIDNDARKHGQIVSGLTVYAPEQYLQEYDSKIRIIIASEYYREMCDQLEELGYKEGKEVFAVWKGRRYYDISEETFNYYIGEAYAGKEIYDRLIDGVKDRHLFICPYAGTGDIYIVGLYLKDYMISHNIKDYILVVSGGGCRKVASLFDVNCISLEQSEIEKLLMYVRLVGLDICRARVLNDGYLQVMVKRMRGYKDVDFHTMFQRCVLEADVKVQDVSIKQENADDIFEQYKLIKGKTVLLSPYANTIYNLSDDFWKKLAKVLIEKGYTVCTNSSGESEPPIKDTEGVFIPYNKIVDFLDKAGCFVGMRSGLCDIVSSTKAKMVVLYPEGNIFGACSTYDYFSIEKMGLKSDGLLEVVFDRDEYVEMLQVVMRFLIDEGE